MKLQQVTRARCARACWCRTAKGVTQKWLRSRAITVPPAQPIAAALISPDDARQADRRRRSGGERSRETTWRAR